MGQRRQLIGEYGQRPGAARWARRLVAVHGGAYGVEPRARVGVGDGKRKQIRGELVAGAGRTAGPAPGDRHQGARIGGGQPLVPGSHPAPQRARHGGEQYVVRRAAHRPAHLLHIRQVEHCGAEPSRAAGARGERGQTPGSNLLARTTEAPTPTARPSSSMRARANPATCQASPVHDRGGTVRGRRTPTVRASAI